VNASHKAWLRALEKTAQIEQRRSHTLADVIDELAARFEDAPALLSEGASLSFGQLAERSNRYARWALAQKLEQGEVVCVLLPNCPEYMALWLGLNRVGVVAALLNTHLSGAVLAHAVNIVAPRGVIAAASLAQALHSARPRIDPSVRCWMLGDELTVPGSGSLPGLQRELSALSGEPLSGTERRSPTLDERALYIYTSGTTGLPKAALVSHLRVMQWSHWFAALMDTQPSDRMYDCLPMYHSIGGVVATGATLLGGGSVVLRERFSAQAFWSDVVAERCTLFQYIGELCRYLLLSPPHPEEQRHRLRLCCGNGLRREVWEPFQRRFRIPRILEYYASTEGSFSLYNCEGRPGSIGRIPPFLAQRVSVALIRLDPASGDPVRDEAGRCVRCRTNEVGEAIGELQDGTGQARSLFEGYVDREASERKIARGVFAPGDAWFRSGDLLRQDHEGFFYFVDRVGDTFRWKGENVSASEVAGVIGSCAGVVEVVVYGVRVPGTEGRAGMAAIVVEAGFALATLRSHVAVHLPEYARPRFVRIVPALEQTGTFKLKSRTLAEEGFDPAAMRDEVYFDHSGAQAYVRLDGPLFASICSGAVRV
jgi:fatty-acyl-CoA synthase